MNKDNVKKIVLSIGRDRLAKEMGVTLFAIRHVIAAGQFPAAWFVVMRKICADRGIECPIELFNFKEQLSPNSGCAA